MDDQITFVYGLGGLISDAVLAELRADRPTGPAKDLTEPATFAIGESNPNARQVEEDIELAYSVNEAAWNTLSSSLDALDIPRLRERLLLPLLRTLGFEPSYQQGHLQGDDGKSYAITHLGWDGDDAPPLILTNRPLDERTGRSHSPHQELQACLNAAPARWGIVANARELRILRDYHHTTTRGAVVVAIADLFEAGSFPDFRALYRLGHATRFAPDQDGESLLERLYQESLSEGVKIGKALQPQVRRALNLLLGGFLAGDTGLRDQLNADPAFGRQLYGELLTTLYRILFLLFAEQRGLLAGASETYRQSYSVNRLRDLAETRAVEARHEDLWEGLKAAFLAFSGDEELAAGLGVHPYNGQLFDPDRTSHLNDAACVNGILLDALRALTTVQIGKVRQYVDYRHIGVEELGSVYESLLNYTIRIADADTTVDGVHVRRGHGYLAPLSIERSELGAYYTPPRLVDLTLSKALDELIDQRITDQAGDPVAQEAALLDLKIIDPACGSAAFLVGAVDRVAAELAAVRAGERAPSERDLQVARRDVLQSCVYGVDVDPFAVELAKVALWIHCAVDDLPLTFLDHKIQCGNSLIGWPMFDLPREIPQTAYDGGRGAEYRAARDRNKRYLSQFAEHQDESEAPTLDLQFLPLPQIDIELPEELLASENDVDAVRRKAAAFERFVKSEGYGRLKRAADVWVSAFFWTPAFGEFPSSKHYHAALAGGLEDLGQIDAVVREVAPLHWPLVFPDVHARGGFDAVVGNPPWERFVTDEKEYFASVGRFDIADLESTPRKNLIKGLADGSESDRRLLWDWERHKDANGRRSHFCKASGRYTPVDGEVNTYVLFTEEAMRLAGQIGRTSIVVKSGIAIDQTPTPVWHKMLDGSRVRSVLDVVNQGTFETVAPVERFCVLSIGPEAPDLPIRVSMLNMGLSEALESEEIALSSSDIVVACPETRTLISAPTKELYELTLSIHRNVGSLALEGANPWDIVYLTLFHSSGDSDLFRKPEVLVRDGWVLDSEKVFRKEDSVMLPVLEGQFIAQLDHRAKSYEFYEGSNKYGRKPHINPCPDDRKSDPSFEIEPRYWMDSGTAVARIEEKAGERALVGIRTIGRPWSDPRSARAALIPRYPATHGLPILALPADLVLEFLAIYNSSVFDFVAKMHLPGANLGMKWVLSQLAIPDPSGHSRLRELAGQLSVTSHSVADAYGFELHQWDGAERPRQVAALDAIVACERFALSREDYETVLDAFGALRHLEMKAHGEYRFKRLCLEAYDRI